MRRLLPRAAVAATFVLLLAACDTVLSENRAQPEEEVRASVTYSSGPLCLEGEDVEVYVGRGEQTLRPGDPDHVGTAGPEGEVDVPFPAPDIPDEYSVQVFCVTGFNQETEEPNWRAFFPTYLIVEPVLTMAASPTQLDPEQTFEVTGNFCVSESEFSDPPVVTVSFEGTDETEVAEEAQPFDGEWTVEFTAPAEAGTYEVTASCVYDDERFAEPSAAETTIAGDVRAAAPSEPQPFPTVQVTVIVDEPEPTTTTTGPTTTTTAPEPTTTTTTPAPAPGTAAQPASAARAQPTFVG